MSFIFPEYCHSFIIIFADELRCPYTKSYYDRYRADRSRPGETVRQNPAVQIAVDDEPQIGTIKPTPCDLDATITDEKTDLMLFA